MRFHGGFDARDFARDRDAGRLVELDGEAVAIRDGEVEADVVADGHGGDGEAAMVHEFLEARAAFAAGGKDGQRLAAEGVDDAGGVDAASAGGIVAGEDVGAVVEGEAVDGDGAVDRRVHGEGDDQVTMVAYGMASGVLAGGIRAAGGSVNWMIRAVAQPG